MAMDKFAHRLYEVKHGTTEYLNARRAQVVEMPTFNTSSAGGRLGPAARAVRFVDYAASVEYEKLSGTPAIGGSPLDFVMKFKDNAATPATVTITCANMIVADGAWDANGDILAMRRNFVANADYSGTSFVTEAA